MHILFLNLKHHLSILFVLFLSTLPVNVKDQGLEQYGSAITALCYVSVKYWEGVIPIFSPCPKLAENLTLARVVTRSFRTSRPMGVRVPNQWPRPSRSELCHAGSLFWATPSPVLPQGYGFQELLVPRRGLRAFAYSDSLRSQMINTSARCGCHPPWVESLLTRLFLLTHIYIGSVFSFIHCTRNVNTDDHRYTNINLQLNIFTDPKSYIWMQSPSASDLFCSVC